MITEISAKYNLVDPLGNNIQTGHQQSFFRGILGTSFIYSDTPVLNLISLAIVPTLILAGASMGIVIFVGIPLGIFSALHENRPGDIIIRIATVMSISFPSFWLH